MIMKMNGFAFLAAFSVSILVSAACFLTAGCATSKIKEETSAENRQIPSSKLGEKLLHAFLDNKAAEFVKLLPAEANFSEKDFDVTVKSMSKNLGTPVSCAFVTNLEHPIANVSIWRIRFERKASDGKTTISQEVLFKTVTAKGNPEVLISWNLL